ncbi:hypothetical protein PFISCL1PPCAC_681, partial [Pristionchus fissidentatus]
TTRFDPSDSQSSDSHLYRSKEDEHQVSLTNNKVDIYTLGLIYLEMCMPMSAEERGDKELIIQMTTWKAEERPSCREVLRTL